MRIDPAAVFGRTVASVPLKLVLVWVAGTAGLLTPIALVHGLEVVKEFPRVVLGFPFLLIVFSFYSEWWSIFGIPLLILFSWRALVFLRDEGLTIDLAWMQWIAALIAIRLSHSRWPLAVILAAGTAAGLVWIQRRLPARPD